MAPDSEVGPGACPGEHIFASRRQFTTGVPLKKRHRPESPFGLVGRLQHPRRRMNRTEHGRESLMKPDQLIPSPRDPFRIGLVFRLDWAVAVSRADLLPVGFETSWK